HEVLPNEQSKPVAGVVEDLVLVDAAAPNPEHRHVGVPRGGEQHLVALVGNRLDERVTRNPIGAAGEDRHTVEDKSKEARSSLFWIGGLVERQRPNTDLAPIEGNNLVAAH